MRVYQFHHRGRMKYYRKVTVSASGQKVAGIRVYPVRQLSSLSRAGSVRGVLAKVPYRKVGSRLSNGVYHLHHLGEPADFEKRWEGESANSLPPPKATADKHHPGTPRARGVGAEEEAEPQPVNRG